MHLGGQIPPDEDIPPEEGSEIENAAFDDGETDSISSPSVSQQTLPLALTTGPRSQIDVLNSGSTSKEVTAADATSTKAEESEGSTPSISPPLTSNPPSAEAGEPVHQGDNALVDGSPGNGSMYSEEDNQADLGSTSPFKAPSASSYSAAVNGDAEAEDTPLSLCVSKPGVENNTHRGVKKDEACSTDEPITSHHSHLRPSAANSLPALTPPASPKAIPAEESCGSGAQQPQEKDADQSKEKSETTMASESLPALDPGLEKDTPQKLSDEPEPSVPAPAPQSQAPRPDKPYSCSECGKAYASRSGLKVRVEAILGFLDEDDIFIQSLVRFCMCM